MTDLSDGDSPRSSLFLSNFVYRLWHQLLLFQEDDFRVSKVGFWKPTDYPLLLSIAGRARLTGWALNTHSADGRIVFADVHDAGGSFRKTQDKG